MSVTRYLLAGFPFEVLAPEGLADRLRAVWSAFVMPEVDGCPFAPRARLHVEVTGPSVGEPVVQLALPSLQRSAEGVWRLQAEDFSAEVTPALCDEVTVRGPDALYPLDVTVRVLLARDLARRGGLLVHGVGIAEGEGERAALFTGDSGAGKSTLGRCAVEGGLLRISDELVAVVPTGDRLWRLCGTPWNAGSASSGVLTNVGVLAHAPRDAVESVAPSEVMRVLLDNVLLAEESAEARLQLVRYVTALLNDVPSVRLSFAPTPRVADTLRAMLRGEDGLKGKG